MDETLGLKDRQIVELLSVDPTNIRNELEVVDAAAGEWRKSIFFSAFHWPIRFRIFWLHFQKPMGCSRFAVERVEQSGGWDVGYFHSGWMCRRLGTISLPSGSTLSFPQFVKHFLSKIADDQLEPLFKPLFLQLMAGVSSLFDRAKYGMFAR